MSAASPERDALLARYPAATAALLQGFVDRLLAAQSGMNLIGPSTIPELWTRHVADSAQLARHAPPGATWLDIGSGAGLPGLVLAILGADVHLVEATGKKARFLSETAEALGLRATVHHARIEALPAFPVDIITARAVKPLAQLFAWGLPFATAVTRWVLPKGATVAGEVAAARGKYRFDHDEVASETSPVGRVILASNVRPR